MLSLYEILKASKTGIAPDMRTALAGMNWGGADSGHEFKELTGIPPLSIRSNGTMLLDYLISGNMVQDGIPTPTTPIQPSECGERTGNLFDNFDIVAQVPSVSNGNLVNSALGGTTSFIKIDSGEIVLSYSINANIYLFLYDNDYQYIGYIQKVNGEPIYSTSISGYSNAAYCRVRVDKLADFSNVNIMLNTGSTALPYEPYGYKIPISSANTTTPIYLGEVETTRKIKKLVLTGKEPRYITIDNSKNIFSIKGVLDQAPQLLQVGGFCSHYKYNNAISSLVSNMSNGDFVLNKIGNNYSFTIKDTSFSANTDFQEYVQQQYAAGTPVTVWYVLATPTTGIVNEPLRKIGDYADTVSYEQAGVQIPTNRGNTVIDVLTELKPSEMYIKYQK